MNISIDNEQYTFEKNESTVREIFLLAQKPAGNLEDYELIRMANGNEDLLYSRTRKPKSTLDDKVLLEDGEVFSIVENDGAITLIVNSEEKAWKDTLISYKQVVELAYTNYVENSDILYTINYFDGPEGKEGSLTKNKEISVIDRMVFNVSKNDKS